MKHLHFLFSAAGLVLIGCSTQQYVTPRLPEFFKPLTKSDLRRAGSNEQKRAKGNPYELELAMRDTAIDSLRRQVKMLRDVAAKLEKMVVPKDQVVLQKGKNVVLQGVNFQRSSAILTKASEAILRKVLVALVANPDVMVEIAGYTDNLGNQQRNEQLSLARAQAVKDWLVDSGIESKRLSVLGMGIRDPIASNTTEEGRAKNRSIEFHVKN
ncbi:MAG: OmpA family protein [Ignavibacteriales bacterium]|nr:OmpA family protein [Ignavibacteriales bacterium]